MNSWCCIFKPCVNMNKAAFAILMCLLALTTAAIVPLDDSDADESVACKYTDEVWGAEDGTKFYFCLPDNNTAILQSCPDNTFFVRNATVTGCIPNSLMDPNCVTDVEVGACSGEDLKQPQPCSSNPNKFYLCTSEGAEPVLLNCPDGKAFVKQDGYLGCFDWSRWRELRQCYTLTNQI
ncbi:uncharacterized protein LOC118738513 [Rhagoletis pomonella]|uniref:uncharacterized protein LOC118738513 n=1 Tax=Rhagoletis pomonella TaxID=28610 RepID=UPI0017821887|nr:uncharacterized protein LOC118738513 [Rhagoletis pomonella]